MAYHADSAVFPECFSAGSSFLLTRIIKLSEPNREHRTKDSGGKNYSVLSCFSVVPDNYNYIVSISNVWFVSQHLASTFSVLKHAS